MNPFKILLGFSLILEIHAKCGAPQKCPCPVISNAAEGRLGQIESTKYLSHRQTFSTGITVSNDCKVSVDISESTVLNSFLLFVRDPEPPIFFRRFTKSTDKNAAVELSELKCVKDGNSFNWYHNEVKINGKFEMTLLDNEECGCEEIDQSRGIEITKIDETCDALNIKCVDKYPFMYGLEGTILFATVTETTMAETMCINKTWHYENQAINYASAECTDSYLDDVKYLPDKPNMKKFVEKCHCPVAFQTSNVPEGLTDAMWKALIKKYRISEEYQNRKGVEGTPVYNSQTCTISLPCPGNKHLAVWSINNKPMIYARNEFPKVQCANMPASSALAKKDVKDYWVDGIHTVNTFYACFD